MPRRISQEKTKARHNLRAMAPLKLHRPIFFVPGWTDQAATCWLEPYTEHGTRRRKDWEYTLSDWTNKIIPEEDQNKIHIIKLIKNEKNLKLDRCKTGPQKGKLKCTNWEKDETSQYTNFYQFAELLKEKIREKNHKEYDLVGHSMGGLDILAAAMLDPKEDTEPEVQEHIKTEPLQGIQHIITVATPFRGTPGGWIVKHTYLDELLMKNWTDAIRQQAEAMSTDSPYIRTLNHP
ncbi:MAG: hypothetical protein HYS08_06190, partial [Chlamydiae bacterium]|nr:hypothetical protein [Chlamydiota bacterium]